jgi:hypothetical protein
MRITTSIIFLLFLITTSFGQDTNNRSYVIQNESVANLVSSFRNYHKNHGMEGYRIQIYTASGNRSKLLTERQKAEFSAAFPGTRSYITYDAPYYKLRVGDFRTRLDAEGFLRVISTKYIYAMVVPDRINLPQIDKDDSGDFFNETDQKAGEEE